MLRPEIRVLRPTLILFLSFLSAFANAGRGEDLPDTEGREFVKIDGYRGIWFDLGQRSEYGSKYSGGLGTYTAKHHPIAVYATAVRKTFFVYGGTVSRDERHLLAMVSYYDHRKHIVPKPTVVHDKKTVNDPHDNPSINLDEEGYIWIFVSGRGRHRSGFKYRSRKPYDIEAFERIGEEEFTYPQPWWIRNSGFVHLFTKYTKGREFGPSPSGRAGNGDFTKFRRQRTTMTWAPFTLNRMAPGRSLPRPSLAHKSMERAVRWPCGSAKMLGIAGGKSGILLMPACAITVTLAVQ